MSDDLSHYTGDEKIVREAHKRFSVCQSWESTARRNWLDDYKFVYGDDLNGWQWPDEMRSQRLRGGRPCLTINKTRQHCLQIINDARQNKVAIKVTPVGDAATKEAAEVFEGIIRHIEYQSVAQSAYDEAIKHQVCSGLGYWRVLTQYEADGFDQEIRIARVADPSTVYLDPDCREADCSDARFGFIFADRPRDEIESEHPQFKGRGTVSNAVDDDDSGWMGEDHIRECEYYRVVEKADKLLAMPDGNIVRASDIDQPMRDIAIKDAVKTRAVITRKVEWFKIIGDKIVDRQDWAGKYIPIVQVVGEETVVDGQLDRRGHARALRDPQRIYNYWSSAAVEFVALQSKAPWVSPAAAIEGYETYWETANTVPHSVIPYKHKDDQGQDIPSPTQSPPPQMAPAFLQGMQNSANEMQMVSGQYQAEMGAPSNERTGIAIQQRQRQGDTATYHYIDGLARSIRYTGRILIDLIPKIYDTQRVVSIMAEDGEQSTVQIDPAHPQAHSAASDASLIFNPSVGKYEVQSDVGPDWGTRNQETFNALTQLMAASPSLIEKAGDLLMKSADFPMSDELAERLKPGPPPQMQAMQAHFQQQAAQQQKLLDQTMQALAEERLKGKSYAVQKSVDIYKAETDRMTALHDAIVNDPNAMREMVRQLVAEAMGNGLGDAASADDVDLKAESSGAPIAGGGNTPAPQPNVGQQMATPGGQ